MKHITFCKRGDKYSRLELTIYAVCWLLVFSLPLMTHVYEVISGAGATFHWEGVWRSYEILLPIFLLFLLNNFVLLPELFWRNKKVMYFVALVVSFAVLWTIQEPPHMRYRGDDAGKFPEAIAAEQTINGDKDDRDIPAATPHQLREPRHKGLIDMFHITNLIIELCVVFANFGIKVYIHSMRREVQMLNIKNEKMQQELVALKYQISPHFLMNTLNNIQSLIESNPVTAYRTLQQLAKMMRYLLYENDSHEVPLQKEIDFMTNFIELMKLRYPDSVKISTDFPDDYTGVNIPPLLFISFLENAFKHGIDYGRESVIKVKVSIGEHQLMFQCVNFVSQNKEKKSGGIGIKNVRRRLDLIYGDNYQLNISESDGLYGVEMKLPI